MIFFSPFALPLAFMLASAATCPDVSPPEVEVALHTSEPKIDTSFTHEELTKGFVSRVAWGPVAEGRADIGGLAESTVEARYDREFEWSRASNRSFCLSVKTVTVDVVYTPLIYIASDQMGRPCAHDLILAHEQRHVGTDLEIMNDLTTGLRDAIAEDVAAALPREPIEGDEASQAAMKDIDQHVLGVMKTYYKKYGDIRAERQSKFDTEENYKTESELCAGRE